jgi:hypothetical protein
MRTVDSISGRGEHAAPMLAPFSASSLSSPHFNRRFANEVFAAAEVKAARSSHSRTETTSWAWWLPTWPNRICFLTVGGNGNGRLSLHRVHHRVQSRIRTLLETPPHSIYANAPPTQTRRALPRIRIRRVPLLELV